MAVFDDDGAVIQMYEFIQCTINVSSSASYPRDQRPCNVLSRIKLKIEKSRYARRVNETIALNKKG